MIRLALPDIGEAEIEAVSAVLRTGYLVQGEQVRQFEHQVAAMVGAEHAVAVSNCTAALHLSLLALGIGSGDRVAVTTYSWPASANAIVLCGAEPVFVDVEPAGMNMDGGLLERTLEADRGIKAVLPVHAFGNMANMPELARLAARRGIPIVEDAACALGATLCGRPAGTWGALGCFSFHPRKAVTTGEGGVVTTSDAELARRLRMLRNHGQDPDAPSPDFVTAGFNLRLTEFQAALGLAQLARARDIIERRRAAAARYTALLAGGDVTSPTSASPEAHVYQSYVVRLPAAAARSRPRLIAALRADGIEVTIGTHHIPLTSYFRRRGGYAPGDFPVTDDVAARALSLPLHTRLTPEDQQLVVERLLAHLRAE